MIDRVIDPSRIGRIGLAGLALAAIAAAMLSGGGPGAGRAEARDSTRWSDLSRLSTLALCIAREEGALPDILVPHDICDAAPPLADPFTGADYGYSVLSAESFRLCAAFERPDRLGNGFDPLRRFDPGTGCLTVQRPER